MKLKGRIDINSRMMNILIHFYLSTFNLDFSECTFVCSDGLDYIVKRLSKNLDTNLSKEIIELIIIKYYNE